MKKNNSSYKYKNKIIQVLVCLLFLSFLCGCQVALPLDIYKDIGESTFSYPEWFKQGKYVNDENQLLNLVFEQDRFSYNLRNNSFEGPAKKVLLTIVDDETFTLTILTNKSGVKFKIKKVSEDEIIKNQIDVVRSFKEEDVETEFSGRFTKVPTE